ncbi:MAG: hypothetical protein K9M99_03530 [Candidatus Cloacimonetes bacterium]|nr:hypothetical protein [Candidatus Cloacimonadota bacterium]
MVQLIGIVIFFSLYKKFKLKFKDKKTTIGILIGLVLLRNFGFMGVLAGNEIGSMIYGFINGGIIFAIFTLIANKFGQEDKIKKEKPAVNPPEGSSTYPLNVPRVNKIATPYNSATLNESHNQTERDTAIAAVHKYLQNRNYKVLSNPRKEFDLVALDNQDAELFITIIAFKNKDNDNKINLPAARYQKIIELGRAHRLFVVTDCFEDRDSSYLGNYVTIYSLDSPIEECGFILQGDRYINTLRKFKKFSYDQEISVRLSPE